MSRERYESELSDGASVTEIEIDLKRALSVSPSMDFETRVLGRIANRDPSQARRWMVYIPLAAAAAVVVVITLAVQESREGREQTPTVAPRTASSESAPTEPAPQVTVPQAAPGPLPVTQIAGGSRRIVPRATGLVARRATGAASPEPEVIVPPRQGEAIRRFVQAIAEGTLEPPPVPQTDGTGAPAPMLVQPLTIQPILVSAAEDRGGPAPVVRPQ